jgi:hypothetical protein
LPQKHLCDLVIQPGLDPDETSNRLAFGSMTSSLKVSETHWHSRHPTEDKVIGAAIQRAHNPAGKALRGPSARLRPKGEVRQGNKLHSKSTSRGILILAQWS